jgi:hypothetical protein
MNRYEFTSAVAAANPGDRVTYYKGFLGEARRKGVLSKDDIAVCRAALELYASGEIELVQKRIRRSDHINGSGTFQYMAVKRRTQGKPPEFQMPLDDLTDLRVAA